MQNRRLHGIERFAGEENCVVKNPAGEIVAWTAQAESHEFIARVLADRFPGFSAAVVSKEEREANEFVGGTYWPVGDVPFQIWLMWNERAEDFDNKLFRCLLEEAFTEAATMN